MTDEDCIKRLTEAIESKQDFNWFYQTYNWQKLSRSVIAEQRECQECKRRGRFHKAQMTHHVNHVDKHPELALTYLLPDGSYNLEAVCYSCHRTRLHPENIKKYRYKATPKLTKERWD